MSLLASFMKLNTKLQIDRKQYQLTCIATEYNRIQDQIQDMTQADDMAKSACESIKASLSNISSSVFTASTSYATQAALDKATAYSDALKAANNDQKDPKVVAAKADMEAAQANAQNVSAGAAATQQASIAATAMISNSINSVFETTNKAQEEYLHNREKSLDLQKGSLETQVKVLSSQYDNYEKLEDADAKKMAPNFGISG